MHWLCILYVFFQYGRTENIKNNLNPEFMTAFEVDYFFEEIQKLKIAVYDIDNKTPDLSDDDFLGQIECTMGQVRSARIHCILGNTRAWHVRWPWT